MHKQKIEVQGVHGNSKVIVIGGSKFTIDGALANYWQRESLISRDQSDLAELSQHISVGDVDGSIVEVVGEDEVALDASEIEAMFNMLQSVIAKSAQVDDATWQELAQNLQVMKVYSDGHNPSLRERAKQAIETIKTFLAAAHLAAPLMQQALNLLKGIAGHLGLPLS